MTETSEIRRHHKTIKKALRKRDLVDPYFVSKYSFSPYQACQHGCLYCDGRAEKYYVEGDFERDVVIKENLPILLEQELGRLREPGTICIGSGISDPYQPVEEEELIVRECAQILAKQDFPISVMTKSSLIRRDMDLWCEVNRKSRFTLLVSLTTTDDHVREIFEPLASSVEDRLEAMRFFAEAGCTIGVLAMPFMPGISDTKESVDALFAELARIGAHFVLPAGLTLRPGRQKDLFINTISRHYPDLVEEYHRLYRENRQSGAPLIQYRKQLNERTSDSLLRYGIPPQMPHRIYRNCFPLYDEIYILMTHMITLFFNRGADVARLKMSLRKYEKWLVAEKKVFNRRRSLHYESIEDSLRALMTDGRLNELIENDKLSSFIGEVVFSEKTFDYGKLKLQ